MNDHPEELLAEFVDGSLDPDTHARVETHLRECDRCRQEVALAGDAVQALTSLREREVPPGVPLAVRRRARREAGNPQTSRWLRAAGIAAVAGVLAAGVVAVFSNIDLGGGASPTSGAGDSGVPEAGSDAPAPSQRAGGGEVQASKVEDQFAATEPPALPTFVESRHEYQEARLASLARRLRDDARDAIASGLAPTANAFLRSFDPSAFTLEVRQAIRCVLSEIPPEQLIVPFRIESASFEGTPAFIGAFLQGPTPDDPYDRIVLWVVDQETCSFLSLATQAL